MLEANGISYLFKAQVENRTNQKFLQTGLKQTTNFRPANAYNILGNASHSTSPSGDLTAGFEFTPDKNITVTGFRRYFGTKISLWKADGTKVLESS